MAVEEEGLRVFQSVKIKIGELSGAGGGAGVFEGARGGRPQAPDPFPGGQGPDASWPCVLPGCGPSPPPGDPQPRPLPTTPEAAGLGPLPITGR